MKRRLISLYQRHDGLRFVSFAYYNNKGKWNGVSEEASIPDDKFYELLKPILTRTKEKVRFI